MDVDDVDDLDELQDMLHQATHRYNMAKSRPELEQAEWDVRDIQDRVDELEQEQEQ